MAGDPPRVVAGKKSNSYMSSLFSWLSVTSTSVTFLRVTYGVRVLSERGKKKKKKYNGKTMRPCTNVHTPKWSVVRVRAIQDRHTDMTTN